MYTEDEIDDIQVDMLNFCGCGNPEDNLLYIRNGLAHLDSKPDIDSVQTMKHGIQNKDQWEIWRSEGVRIFGSEGARLFFLYWADTANLTEHGSSVYGSWLTDKGRELLSQLNKMYCG